MLPNVLSSRNAVDKGPFRIYYLGWRFDPDDRSKTNTPYPGTALYCLDLGSIMHNLTYQPIYKGLKRSQLKLTIVKRAFWGLFI